MYVLLCQQLKFSFSMSYKILKNMWLATDYNKSKIEGFIWQMKGMWKLLTHKVNTRVAMIQYLGVQMYYLILHHNNYGDDITSYVEWRKCKHKHMPVFVIKLQSKNAILCNIGSDFWRVSISEYFQEIFLPKSCYLTLSLRFCSVSTS